MMTNKPEYVIVELAVAKLGATSALLNYNLKGEPLMHSLQVAGSKLIVFDDDLSAVVKATVDQNNELKAVCIGPKSGEIKWAVSVDKTMDDEPDTPPGTFVSLDSVSLLGTKYSLDPSVG